MIASFEAVREASLRGAGRQNLHFGRAIGRIGHDMLE
jgi:hypothetical protein